jgi:hypothetical protein
MMRIAEKSSAILAIARETFPDAKMQSETVTRLCIEINKSFVSSHIVATIIITTVALILIATGLYELGQEMMARGLSPNMFQKSH